MNKKKEYKKMMKRYKKLFKKSAKELLPFDWSYGLDLLVNFLKWMKDYYELGYNVWTSEIPGDKSRKDSLKETLHWYDRWMNVCDDYYKTAYNEEELKHYKELGFRVVEHTDDAIEELIRKMGYVSLTLYDSEENLKACCKAEEDYKHKFFECLEKYLESWWD